MKKLVIIILLFFIVIFSASSSFCASPVGTEGLLFEEYNSRLNLVITSINNSNNEQLKNQIISYMTNPHYDIFVTPYNRY